MKCIKEYVIDDTVTSSKEQCKNFSNSLYSICGKNNTDEYKILLKLDINKIKELCEIEGNVTKVELCYYLYELSLNNCSDAYMLNMGINLDDFNVKEVTYEKSPTYYQESCIYKLKKEFVGQYINFDISNIIKKWIKGDKENFGLTLLGLNSTGIVCFTSIRGKEKPYIRIHYKNDPDYCNNKIIEHNTYKKNANIKYKKSYGYIINKSGDLYNKNGYYLVCWDRISVAENIELSRKNTEILIKDKGIYQIDFGVNLRSNDSCIIQMEINKSALLDTRIEIACIEGISQGSSIVEVKENNNFLEIKIIGENLMLVNKGVSAYIRIIQI